MSNLERAAELLEQGWCVGDLLEPEEAAADKFCAVGALAYALGLDKHTLLWEEHEAYDLVRASDEGKALADEIMESEWFANQSESFKENCEAEYGYGGYDEIIFSYNDRQDAVAPVLETFKFAAKRLDPKD